MHARSGTSRGVGKSAEPMNEVGTEECRTETKMNGRWSKSGWNLQEPELRVNQYPPWGAAGSAAPHGRRSVLCVECPMGRPMAPCSRVGFEQLAAGDVEGFPNSEVRVPVGEVEVGLLVVLRGFEVLERCVQRGFVADDERLSAWDRDLDTHMKGFSALAVTVERLDRDSARLDGAVKVREPRHALVNFLFEGC